jgi:hypothetical protein
MQDQCDLIAASYEVPGSQNIWSGAVVFGSPTLTSGPSEVSGSRVIDEDTVEGAGTFTPAGVYIDGDPYRVGGSVNMFGFQRATGGSWSASTYNYDANFDTTFSWSFSCDVSEEVYVPEQIIEVRAQGQYVFNDDGKGSDEDAIRANCEQYTDNGQPWWGTLYRPNEQTPRCIFDGTPAYTDIIPAYWEAPVFRASVTGTPVNQDQNDNLRGYEANGSGFSIGGDVVIGQVVVCISPATNGNRGNPGAWRTQNGYTGELCNTAHFNVAEWGAGSTTSNGTYISVPPQ